MGTSEFSCPKCGSTEKFEVSVSLFIEIDGNRKVLDLRTLAPTLSEGIDKNGDCICVACGHEDLVFEFQERRTGIINIPEPDPKQ